MEEGVRNRFRDKSFFTGPNARQGIAEGYADYVPVFLSEIPLLFRRRAQPVNVALIQVSPPDAHGFCSLGPSVDVSRAAVQVADAIVAQVNSHMPRTHGDGIVHVSHLDAVVESHVPLPSRAKAAPSPVEDRIGKIIAENLVQDGATLQMGIGAIPDAVLAALGDHKDLGIHTEMFSDGVIPLVESGVITNGRKSNDAGKIVTSFAVGSQRLYDFIDDNPFVVFYGVDVTNDTSRIKTEYRVTAINSAIEVDLTGQVVSDSIGTRIYSGVGGQVDFIRGAGLCPEGRPIIALPSTTRRGESRIVSILKPGGGVVTTRAHVHYVVTEYGIAELWGKSLRERAAALINIAHPDHRDGLRHEAQKHLNTTL
jgi:acyl-CoA hydrolase